MIVKNNYNECITNLACSIRKYFGLNYKNNTLSYVDKLLEEKQPKNVVVVLFDGMGSRILDRILNANDFFIKNRLKEITTVFPATTTAATYSIMNGLNPVEHGYLGWYSYVEPIDEVIMLFTGINKETQELSEKYPKAKQKYFINKTITDEINEKGKYKSRILFPFGEENPLFRSALGDYIAIAENSNKTLLINGDEELFSQHAGYTDDEIYIPLIIIDKTKDNSK